MSGLEDLDIVIRRKNGAVIAGVPQLRIYAKAATVNDALAVLETKRTVFEQDLREAGYFDEAYIAELAGNQRTPTRGARRGELTIFALKTGIVVAILTVATVVAGVLMVSQAERAVDQAIFTAQTRLLNTRVGGGNFWAKVEAEIDRAASPGRDIPEEKKKKLLANIRTLVERWRPFVSEVGLLFMPPPQK